MQKDDRSKTCDEARLKRGKGKPIEWDCMAARIAFAESEVSTSMCGFDLPEQRTVLWPPRNCHFVLL